MRPDFFCGSDIISWSCVCVCVMMTSSLLGAQHILSHFFSERGQSFVRRGESTYQPTQGKRRRRRRRRKGWFPPFHKATCHFCIRLPLPHALSSSPPPPFFLPPSVPRSKHRGLKLAFLVVLVCILSGP